MAITVTPPPNRIINFAAVASAGGNLAASTVYEFRISAKNVALYPPSNNNNRISEPSRIITATTDAVNKLITLTWTYITGYNYYFISYRVQGNTDWITLRYTSVIHYSMIATQQAECTVIFDNTDAYPAGDTTAFRSTIWQDINNPFPMPDKVLGLGKVAITGAAGDLTPDDILVACKASIAPASFVGSGLDDMITSGTYTSETDKRYVVEIDATGTPDTFKWSSDDGATWTASGVAITGAAQTLENGVTVTFNATTGHTLADQWEFRGGHNNYYIWRGTTIYTMMHLEVNATSGSLDYSSKNIYPMQGRIDNQNDGFDFDMSYSGVYLTGYGWRFDTDKIDLTHAQILRGNYGGLPSKTNKYLWSNNVYIYVRDDTVMLNAKLWDFESQIYAGSTMESVNGRSFRINSLTGAGGNPTQIIDCFGAVFSFLYNQDWTGWGTDVYEIRNFKTYMDSTYPYDIYAYYNSKEHRLYDFEGANGFDLYSDYDKPQVRWRPGTTDSTFVHLYHLLGFNIIDEEGNNIENATITVYDKDGNQLWTDTTDVNGEASDDIETMTIGWDSVAGGQYDSDYVTKNPLRIVIQKSGFKKADFKETITESRDPWTITLYKNKVLNLNNSIQISD